MYSQEGNGNPLAPVGQPAATGTANEPGAVAQPIGTPQAPQQVQPQPSLQPAPAQQPAAVSQPTPAPQQVRPEPAQYVSVQAPQPAPAPAAVDGAMAPQPQPAAINEIQAACPGAPADFVLQMVQQNATLAQAQTAFIQWQATELSRQRATAAATPAVPQYQPQMPGNQPVQPEPPATDPSAAYPGGAKQHWEMLVRDKKHLYMQAGVNASEANIRALREVDQENPGLRQQAFEVRPLATPYGLV